MKEVALSSVVPSFSTSTVSFVLCIYRESTVCWHEVLIVFIAVFLSTFLGLTFVNYVRSAIFHKSRALSYEEVITIVVIFIVFCVMFFGNIWSPPGTYNLIERFYPEDVHFAAFIYSFLFELYKFVGILLLLISFVASFFRIEMQVLRESSYSCLINWFSMKTVFSLFAIPSFL